MLLCVLCECVVRNQGREQSEEIAVLIIIFESMILFDIALLLTFAVALQCDMLVKGDSQSQAGGCGAFAV